MKSNDTKTRMAALLLLLSSAVLATACSETGQSKADNESVAEAKATDSTGTGDRTLTPEGWIVVGTEAVIPVVDDLTRHLDRANAAYRENELEEAGQHLREAAKVLQNEGGEAAVEALEHTRGKATADLQNALDESSSELERIAQELEAGGTVDEVTLAKSFRAAHEANTDQRYLVEEDLTMLPYHEQPQVHFTEADRDLASRDFQAAAQEIRKGAAYLRMEAASAEGIPKEALLRSTLELRRLAQDLDHGGNIDKTTLHQAFARASHARALQHHALAASSWAKEENARTGDALSATVSDVRDGIRWSGHEIAKGTSATLEEIRVLSGEMVEGGGWAVDEVGQGIEKAGSEIENLGKWLSSPDFESAS